MVEGGGVHGLCGIRPLPSELAVEDGRWVCFGGRVRQSLAAGVGGVTPPWQLGRVGLRCRRPPTRSQTPRRDSDGEEWMPRPESAGGDVTAVCQLAAAAASGAARLTRLSDTAGAGGGGAGCRTIEAEAGRDCRENGASRRYPRHRQARRRLFYSCRLFHN